MTPEEIPDETFCRVLFIPDDEVIQAAVNGALLLLTEEENWQQHGDVTPAEMAECFMSMYFDYIGSVGACMQTGMIVAYGGASAPDGWLLCDGAYYLANDFPDLYDVIGTTYGASGGAGTFNVPDFRGRDILGAGSGAGLTPRSRGDTGGGETHQLTVSEMPAHTHTAHSHGAAGLTGELVAPVAGAVVPGTATGSTGGDGAHTILDPFGCAHYCIKT